MMDNIVPPNSILTGDSVDYSPEKLKEIYDRAGLSVYTIKPKHYFKRCYSV